MLIFYKIMMNVFSENYVPKKLLHREFELNEIKSIFDNFDKYNMGTNLIIRGVSGSGKTSLVRNIITERQNSLFISCRETKTAFKSLKSMFNYVGKRHISDLISYIISYLKENRKILIFDEVDKLKDFSEFIDILNTIYRNTMIPIILVTVKFNLTSLMPDDAVKTLFFEKINLPSYKSSEIKDILENRIELSGLDKNNIPSHVVPLISAIAGKIGSCRVAISIFSRCLQRGNFDELFIKKVYEDLEKEDWFGFYQDLNETERNFLKILLEDLKPNEVLGAGYLKKRLSEYEGKNYSLARISQIINLFENYSVLRSFHKNMGRGGGRKRYVKFFSEGIYKDILKSMDKRVW